MNSRGPPDRRRLSPVPACPSQQFFAICNLLFAINTSKPPAPVALEGRLCRSAKPHEYKRSLVWLNLPPPTKLGIPRARVATALYLQFAICYYLQFSILQQKDFQVDFPFENPTGYKKPTAKYLRWLACTILYRGDLTTFEYHRITRNSYE